MSAKPMDMPFALLSELDTALATSAVERHSDILQKVADLFALGASNYSNEQIALFDDVFTRLVTDIETSARAALAVRLAANPLAPAGVSRILACDDSVAVAGPLLERSERIDAVTLAQCSLTKSQEHLLAISRRRYLDESLTDILVERGNRAVVLNTVENLGARFSDFGFTTLIARSEGDDELAASVGSRRELPRHYLLKLLVKASDTVRRKLELADPLGADSIRNAVAEAATLVQAKTIRASRSYSMAETYVDAMQTAGQLNENALAAFAEEHKIEETVVALARLCEISLEIAEMAMMGERPESILILSKAVGMSWPTVKMLLALRQNGQRMSSQTLEQCLGTFSRLKPSTARQVLMFQRKRSSQAAQLIK